MRDSSPLVSKARSRSGGRTDGFGVNETLFFSHPFVIRVFLAYLDSSGRANFTDKENFVLASIVTSERNWQFIENGMKQIKLKHFPTLPDSEVEIHAKDMVNHDGIFKTLSWNEIYAIFDDVFDFVANPQTEIAVIGVIIDKTKLYKDKDIEIWAHRLMFERISQFIERQNAKLVVAGYPNEFGIMISDSEGEVKDQKLRSKLIGMLRKGTYYCKLDYLIEDPLFTNSKWRNLSQLVDCIAYCIHKRYRTNNTPSFHTTHWQNYFTKIETKLDTPNGSYVGYGIKIFP